MTRLKPVLPGRHASYYLSCENAEVSLGDFLMAFAAAVAPIEKSLKDQTGIQWLRIRAFKSEGAVALSLTLTDYVPWRLVTDVIQENLPLLGVRVVPATSEKDAKIVP